MILEQGDKIHLATRRLLEDEARRHFVGQVQATDGALARVEGYAFVLRAGRNEWARRPERRTRIISLSDGTNIVNVLPRAVDLALLQYRTIDGRLFVTDGKAFRLDVNEFGPER